MADDQRVAELPESPLSIERWREEIDGFGRQTSSQLQQIVAALDDLSSRVSQRPAGLPTMGLSEGRPSSVPSRRPLPESDGSQDRLANLKKMLAAKLSNGEGSLEGGAPSG